ncbi:protein sel-1 homolog 3-like isoform X2 [Physella acuta]|uniref:protein sel-1 homolog 3-like isoform X2 n=1 Tax=Physella acuta TaxID=109671 RepID=UPI0027DC3B99|nr:protein sel-1 homolog 3-like isoform X2 [Physella acuta]
MDYRIMSVLIIGVITYMPVITDEQVDGEAAGSDVTTNFVRVREAPDVLAPGRRVKVEYQCEEDGVVVVDLTVMLQESDKYRTVFSRAWRCKGQGLDGKPRTKSIYLRPPECLLYRPDFFNQREPVWIVTWSKLRAWLYDVTTWTRHSEGENAVNVKSRDFHKIQILPPYSRPFKRPKCSIWIWPLLQKLYPFSDSQTCRAEKEFVTLLDYPAVFNGYAYSFIRSFDPFKDPGLERDRRQKLYSPQLTIEMWVYILDYCPMHYLSPANACGLFLHMDRQGNLLTPAILINKDGNIQIDVKSSSGYIAMKSTDIVPRNIWTRIVFTMYYRTWILHVNYGHGLKDGFWTSHTYNEDMYVDDTEGLLSIGGIDWTMGSFVGYYGRVTYHRQRVLAIHQLSLPDPYHPMFELQLSRRKEKCQNFLGWMDSAVDVYQRYSRYVIGQRTDSCPYETQTFFSKYRTQPEDVTTCPARHPFNLRNHRHVSRLLRRVVSTHSLSTNFLHGGLEAYSRNFKTEDSKNAFHDISVGLIDEATSIVSEKGLRNASRVVHLLRQAACLGNDDAMFSLAVLLNNGVGVAADELQSLAFFMLGTLNRHVFSIMALAHRHTMGIDGAPVDLDVAYMYFKQVADRTRTDKEEHKDSGIATESIRLIDEAQIAGMTSEVGDFFLWLKNQAEKGVATAQSELGALLYHGARGLKRNLQTAVNIFREGAESGNVDAMFNYGLMQYRGLGTQANKTEGRIMMQKAAEMKNPDAVSALGWLAMEEDKNYTEAFRLFQIAKTLGHRDSGYYLGYMYHFGLVPGSPVNLDQAMEQYLWSARLNQIDAGDNYAFLLSRGTPKYPRNSRSAGEWARFIAEKNGNLAKPLRNAINAYRDENYDLALYLYMQLADTGLEVASFNLAYLCEQNKGGVTAFISKECEFRHYNMTVQREFQFVDAYSYLKMGDYLWYGCKQKSRDLDEAAMNYCRAAMKGNPQALFNLAYMVEEGVPVNIGCWMLLRITNTIYKNRVSLLLELYARCRESRQSEAFMPCCLAWFRVWFVDVWETHELYIKITSFLTILLTFIVSTYLVYCKLTERQERLREETQKLEEEEEERRILDEAQVI